MATPGGSATDLDGLVAQAQREHLAGRLAEAATAYRQILAIRPDIAEVHNNLAIILAQQGRLAEAAASFAQVIALRPELPLAHYNLGSVLSDLGRLDEAAAGYERAIALRPDYAEACNNLAIVLRNQGKLDEAAARLRQAIALRPDDAEAYSNLGDILAAQGRLDEAAVQLEKAIALASHYASAHNNLGNVLAIQGKLDEAIARFQQAIACDPGFAEAHNNLAGMLWKQERFDEAAAHVSRALALRPDFPDALNSLGYLLAMQNHFDEAAARFSQALALRPGDLTAHDNLARVCLVQGKFDQSEAHFKQMLSRVPDHAEAAYGLATCYLTQGDFRRGWPAYESRLRLLSLPSKPDLPRWNGEPLAGRRLILLAEQGLGDTLQFLRFARVLKSRGAHLTLVVQPPLARLLAAHPDLDAVLVAHENLRYPAADFSICLLSLPGVLGTDLSNIPAEVPYLSADPELMERWRRELATIEGCKVGIVWQVARDFPPYLRRSIPLAQFAPLASVPGVKLISLQKGAGSEQIRQVGFPVLDFGDRLDEAAGPFMDTAAIIANLDLLVSVDTSITHLAGALGAPVFLALYCSSEWRWLCDRDDSPWYPSVRLFRQKTFGQWPEVFERIAKAIQHVRRGGQEQTR